MNQQEKTQTKIVLKFENRKVALAIKNKKTKRISKQNNKIILKKKKKEILPESPKDVKMISAEVEHKERPVDLAELEYLRLTQQLNDGKK